MIFLSCLGFPAYLAFHQIQKPREVAEDDRARCGKMQASSFHSCIFLQEEKIFPGSIWTFATCCQTCSELTVADVAIYIRGKIDFSDYIRSCVVLDMSVKSDEVGAALLWRSLWNTFFCANIIDIKVDIWVLVLQINYQILFFYTIGLSGACLIWPKALLWKAEWEALDPNERLRLVLLIFLFHIVKLN